MAQLLTAGRDARDVSGRVHADMGSPTHRLNVTLDSERAAKLSRLAARVHVNEGTLARSLLSSAIDDADPDPANIAALLDGIHGAYERAQLACAKRWPGTRWHSTSCNS
jgi:hypothetical protein